MLVAGLIAIAAIAAIVMLIVQAVHVSRAGKEPARHTAQSVNPEAEETVLLDQGRCGEGLTWAFDSSGQLYIRGSGAMDDWERDAAPWNRYRRDISSVFIAQGVTRIGKYAFADCAELNSVSIPDSIQEIRSYAFYKCAGLPDVKIPGSVTKIGYAVFFGCSALADVNYAGNEAQWTQLTIGEYNEPLEKANKHYFDTADLNVNYTDMGSCGDDLIWVLDKNGTLSVRGSGVMFDWEENAAPWNANRESIRRVALEQGVTSVGDYAFCDCVNLESLSIPESVRTIGSHAFTRCGSLTELTLPDGVVSVGERAVAECRGLTSLSLPDSLTQIESYAFAWCSGLSELALPRGLSRIEYHAFSSCTGLTGITIPDGVTDICSGAFAFCGAMKSVRLQVGVTRIDKEAFSVCDRLSDVYYTGSPSQWAQIAIGDSNDALLNAEIHCNAR